MTLMPDSYRAAVDAAAIYTETDPFGIITYANPLFCKISGYTLEELVGSTHRVVSSDTHDRVFFKNMWSTISSGKVWKGVICNRRKGGKLYWVDSTIVPMVGENGKVERYVSIRFDITDRQVLLEDLRWRVSHDELTGLMNRAAITNALEKSLSTLGEHAAMAVVALDLDSFSAVNERYGKSIGDKLLCKVASRLRNCIGPKDYIGRIESNLFSIVLEGIEVENDAGAALQRLMQCLRGSFSIGRHRINITACAGYTTVPADQREAGVLLRHSNQALYLAKHAEAQNNIEQFDLETDEYVRSTLRTVTRVRNALNNGELDLFYQPKVRMCDGVVEGFEALLRWNHPTEGIICPNEFLPFIEGNDVICEIGEWCIGRALTQIGRWRAAGKQWSVSVNISARHFQRKDFLVRLNGLLAAQEVYAWCSLDLEIIESVAQFSLEQASYYIDECKRIGVTSSLDDFGTGYSSLSYLKQLRSDTIKIDKSFIQGITSNLEDRVLVEAIIRLASVMGRSAVAEGVETAEQAALLREMGCETAQGYLYARPMPSASVIPWYVSSGLS